MAKITPDHLREVDRRIDAIIDGSEEQAVEEIAARYGLDPTDLGEAYREDGE